MMASECLACGSPNPFRRSRCDSCYRFWLRHGRDRTFDELYPLLLRRFIREQEAELYRGILASGS
jgi:hypothetical protein